jgi:galactose mutarotase-like enzyme
VNPVGAELSSLKNLETEVEHLWQGNPEFWASQAPNLFPVIGVLKNGEFFFDGRTYKMPKHGFIRYNEEIQLKERTESKLTFQMEHSKKTLEIYPFKFRFEVSFILKGKRFSIWMKNHFIFHWVGILHLMRPSVKMKFTKIIISNLTEKWT